VTGAALDNTTSNMTRTYRRSNRDGFAIGQNTVVSRHHQPDAWEISLQPRKLNGSPIRFVKSLNPKTVSTAPPRHMTLTERPFPVAYCRTTN
jgi:hypothetical protein